MRFSQTQMSLPAYYDRRAKMDALAYAAELVGPHVPMIRVEYTLPDTVNAFIEHVSLMVCRDVAASSPKIAGAWVTYTDPFDNEIPVLAVRKTLSGVGDSVQEAIGCNIFLLPGRVVRIYTMDASTGGSHTFSCGVSIVYWPR